MHGGCTELTGRYGWFPGHSGHFCGSHFMTTQSIVNSHKTVLIILWRPILVWRNGLPEGSGIYSVIWGLSRAFVTLGLYVLHNLRKILFFCKLKISKIVYFNEVWIRVNCHAPVLGESSLTYLYSNFGNCLLLWLIYFTPVYYVYICLPNRNNKAHNSSYIIHTTY
jgi:hypothetical protein